MIYDIYEHNTTQPMANHPNTNLEKRSKKTGGGGGIAELPDVMLVAIANCLPNRCGIRLEATSRDAVRALRVPGRVLLSEVAYTGRGRRKNLLQLTQRYTVTELRGRSCDMDLPWDVKWWMLGPHKTYLKDKDMSVLGRCTSLTKLDIHGCRTVTDQGFRALSACTALTHLTLWDCSSEVTTSYELLSRSLSQLRLSNCRATDACLRGVATCALRRVDVVNCNVTDSGIEALAVSSSMESITVDYCNQLNGTGFGALGNLAALTEVHLRLCKGISNDGIQALACCTALTKLEVVSCKNVADGGLGALANCTALKRLHVSGCDDVTEEGLSALHAALPDCNFFAIISSITVV